MLRSLCSFLLVLAVGSPGAAQDKEKEKASKERNLPQRIVDLPAEYAPKGPCLPVDEVYASVADAFPPLAAAVQERAIAAGQALTARGAFDLGLRVSESLQTGTYDNQRFDARLVQPIAPFGADTTAGYRLGSGNYPSYYLDRKTAEGGEFFANLALPLLRDRALDRRRAVLRQADINVQLADPVVQRQRITFFRDAGLAYWTWVNAGERLRIAVVLLKVAEQRDEFFRRERAAGKRSERDVLENQQLLVQRRARLHEAEQRLQTAAVNLSLYARDERGCPRLPAWDRMARFPETVAPLPAGLPGDTELALRQRPEPRRFQLLRQREQVNLDLAQVQTLPGLTANLTAAQDVGQGGSTLDRATYGASVVLDVPLQRRAARGQILTSQGNISQLSFQEEYARNSIVAEVQSAWASLDRFHAQRVQAAENVRLNRDLVDREYEIFHAGRGNLLNINIRENFLFDAQTLEADAALSYFRALVEFRAALGGDALELPPPPADSSQPR